MAVSSTTTEVFVNFNARDLTAPQVKRMVNGFNQAATEIEGAGRRMNGTMKSVHQQMVDMIRSFGVQATVAGAGLSVAFQPFENLFLGIVKTGADMEQQMNKTLGAFLDQLDGAAQKTAAYSALLEEANRVGVKYALSNREAAEALEVMGKAGRDVDEAITELEPVVQFAEANTLDLAKAAEIVAITMTQFSKQGLTATEVVSAFTGAALGTTLEVEDLGMSFRHVGSIVAGLGIPFEQAVTLMAGLGQRGVEAARGATALRGILIRSISPTKEAADQWNQLGINLYEAGQEGEVSLKSLKTVGQEVGNLRDSLGNQEAAQLFARALEAIGVSAVDLDGKTFSASKSAKILLSELENIDITNAEQVDDIARAFEELGLSIFTSTGKMRPLTEIMPELNQALSEYSEEQKSAILNTLFTNRGLEGAAAMLGITAEEWEELTAIVADGDQTLQELTETIQQGLNYNLEVLRGTLETVASAIYESVKGPITDFVQMLTRLAEAFQNANPLVHQIAFALIAVGAAFGAIIAPMILMIGMFALGVSSIGALWIVLGPLIALMTVLAGGFLAVRDRLDEVRQAIEPARLAFAALIAAFGGGNAVVSQTASFFERFWNAFGTAFIAGIYGVARGFQLLVDILLTVMQVLNGTWESAEGIHPFVRAIGEATQALVNFWPQIVNFAEAVANFVSAAWDAVSGLDWGGFINTVTGAFDTAMDGVSRFVSFASRELGAFSDYLNTTVGPAMYDFATGAFDYWNTSVLPQITSFVDTAILELNRLVVYFETDISPTVETWGNNIINPLNNTVIPSIRTAVNTILAELDRLKNWSLGTEGPDFGSMDRADVLSELQSGGAATGPAITVDDFISPTIPEDVRERVKEITDSFSGWFKFVSTLQPLEKKHFISEDGEEGATDAQNAVKETKDILGKFFDFLSDNQAIIIDIGVAVAGTALAFGLLSRFGLRVTGLFKNKKWADNAKYGADKILEATGATAGLAGMIKSSGILTLLGGLQLGLGGTAASGIQVNDALSVMQILAPVALTAIVSLATGLGWIPVLLSGVIAAVSLFGLAWTENWFGIQEKAQPVIDALYESLGILRDAFNRAFEFVQPIIDNQLSVFRTEVEKLKEALADLKESFRLLYEEIQPLLPVLEELSGILLAGLIVTLSMVIGVMTGTVTALTTFITGIVQVVTGFVQVVDGVLQVIRGIFIFLDGLITYLDGLSSFNWDEVVNGFQRMSDGIERIVEGIIKIIEGLLQAMIGTLTTTVGTLTSFIAGFLVGMLGALDSFVEAFTGVSVWDTIVTFIEDTFNEVKETIFNIWAEITEGIPEKIDELSSDIADAIDKFPDLLEPLETFVRTIVKIFENFGGGTVLGAFTGFVDDVIGGAERFITEGLPFVTDFISGIGTEFGKLVTDALESAKTFVDDTIGAVERLITEGLPDVVSFVADSVSELLSFAIQGSKHAYDGVQWIIDEVEKLVTDGVQWVRDFVTDAISALGGLVTGGPAVVTAFIYEMYLKFQGLITSATGWGRDVVQGLIDGLWSKVGELTAPVDAIIGIFNKIPLSQEIRSPSKLWAQWGAWLVEGLALGITQEQADLLKAIVDVVSSIADTVEKYLDISNRISTEKLIPIDLNKLRTIGEQIRLIVETINGYLSGFGVSEEGAEQFGRNKDMASGILDLVEQIVSVLQGIAELTKTGFTDLNVIGQLKLALERAITELNDMFIFLGEEAITNASFAAQALGPVSEAFSAVIDFFTKLSTAYFLVDFNVIGELKAGIEFAIQNLDWMFRTFHGDWLDNATKAATAIVPVADAFIKIIDFLEKLTFSYYEVDFAAIGQLKLAIERAIMELDFMFREFGQEWLQNAQRAAETASPVLDAFEKIFALLEKISLGYFEVDFEVFGRLKLALERAIMELSYMFGFLGPGVLAQATQAAAVTEPVANAFMLIADMVQKIGASGNSLHPNFTILEELRKYIEEALLQLFLAFETLGAERIIKAERIIASVASLGESLAGFAQFVERLRYIATLDLNDTIVQTIVFLLRETVRALGEAFDQVGPGLLVKAEKFTTASAAIAEALTAGLGFLKDAGQTSLETFSTATIDQLVFLLTYMVTQLIGALDTIPLLLLTPAQQAAEAAAVIADSLKNIFEFLGVLAGDPVIAVAEESIQTLVDTMILIVTKVHEAIFLSAAAFSEESLSLVESFGSAAEETISALLATIDFLLESMASLEQAIQNVPSDTLIQKLVDFLRDLMYQIDQAASAFTQESLELDEKFASASSNIIDAITKIPDALDAIKKIKPLSEVRLKVLKDFFASLLREFHSIAKNYSTDSLELLEKFSGAAENLLNAFAAIPDALDGIAGFVAPSEKRLADIKAFFHKVVQTFLELANEFTEAEFAQVEQYVKRLQEALKLLQDAAGDMAGGGSGGGSGGSGGGGGGSGGGGSSVENLTEQANALEKALKAAAAGASWLGRKVLDASGGVQQLYTAIGYLITRTQNVNQQIADVSQQIKRLRELGASDATIKPLQDRLRMLKTSAKELGSAFKEAVEEIRAQIARYESLARRASDPKWQKEYAEQAKKLEKILDQVTSGQIKNLQALQAAFENTFGVAAQKKLPFFVNSIIDGFKVLKTRIGDLMSVMYESGRHLTEELAKGIIAGRGAIQSAAALTADEIKAFLGFSLPEKGPLADADTYMPHFIDVLATGIQENRNRLLREVSGLAKNIDSAMQSSMQSLAASRITPQGQSILSMLDGNFVGAINLGGVTIQGTGDPQADGEVAGQAIAQAILRELEQRRR